MFAQHWHRPMLESVLKIDSFDYIFSVVRDPVARLVSEYKWLSSIFDGIDVWYERVRDNFLKIPICLTIIFVLKWNS